MVVGEGELEVDYGLVDKGVIIKEDFISVIMDGTFHPANEEHPRDQKKEYQTMPIRDEEAQTI